MTGSHHRRAVLVAVTLLVVAGAGWSAGRGTSASTGAAAETVTTARVVLTDLASTTQLSATLGYAGLYDIVAEGPAGTLTALPGAGQVVTRGQMAYELDGSPVALLYGNRPMWRPFGPGMATGPDVRQLEDNLVALGYASAGNLTVDDTFTLATSAAIRRWQVATGRAVTGLIPLGAVCFQPGPMRVATLTAPLGSTTGPGTTVLRATSPTPVVNLPVPAQQTFLVHAGDAVTVTLPNGSTTPGTVASLSTVATGADSASPTNGPQPQSGPIQATIPALVSLSQPDAVANLDQAPVTVNVTDHLVKGVLAVPVTALVALAGGGYGVYVDPPARQRRRLVAVTPGLFATTLVQVTPAGGPRQLQAGDQVEIPAP